MTRLRNGRILVERGIGANGEKVKGSGRRAARSVTVNALESPLGWLFARGMVSRRRFEGAVESAGAGLSDILWRVVCSGEGMRDAETALGWPARAGKVVLCLALDRIADFYRIR